MTSAVAHDHAPGHAHDHDHEHGDHEHGDHEHDHGHSHPHPAEDNSFAGKGAVLVDIGDGFGACIINAPEPMIGLEIEYRRLDVPPELPLKHVAVVPRRTPSGKILPTAVYPSLAAGSYEFYVRPNGDVKLGLDVVDGEIVTRDWPES